eukprot:1563701-Amphidinium_carterae.2
MSQSSPTVSAILYMRCSRLNLRMHSNGRLFFFLPLCSTSTYKLVLRRECPCETRALAVELVYDIVADHLPTSGNHDRHGASKAWHDNIARVARAHSRMTPSALS